MLDTTTPAAEKVLDWARAWVENETGLPDCAAQYVQPDEREALKLLRELGVINWDRG